MAEAKLITGKLRRTRFAQASLGKMYRQLLFSFFRQLPVGKLTVHDGDEVFHFGTDDSIDASLVVRDPRFYGKILTGGSIGSGEAFFEGWWESNDTTKVVELFAANLLTLDRLENKFKPLVYPFTQMSRWLTKNTKKTAKKNIMAHYDLGNELYTRFLDDTMSYSSGIYHDENANLLDASLNKLKTVCERLDLKASDHLIEIGTGWGGLAIYAAQNYGCRVTTTTISEEQFAFASNKVKSLGLEDKITLLKKDYRELEGQYDKLVSIEMIEAVGHEFLQGYFQHCDRLLKPGGKLLIQSILIDHSRYEQYRTNIDFIQKYIFPGGHLPSAEIIHQLTDAGTQLVVDGVHRFGKHYARTLEDWRKAFNRRWDEIQKHGYDEKFRKLWNYYFHYCEGGFLQERIDVAHFVMSKA